ncbi:MAG: DNA mismatch repair protein MutS [Candidatus Abawacabacteria bacterium]|nr:DNA mismatch repair protein MutS [Candidatus Abawacabacteria bacterium]
MKKLTPMLQQYFAIKAQYPDCVLLFRLGDFYEMFGTDAELASQILHIALTARNKGTENEIAMCGFPHFSADQYTKKLIRAGHKVAICDQISDPNLPGIVERDVTRVITPGTLLSDDEDETKLRLLAAVSYQGQNWEVLFCNVSTGELMPGFGTTLPDILEQLHIRQPTEILLAKEHEEKVQSLLRQSNIIATVTGLSGVYEAEGMIRHYIERTQKSATNYLHQELHREAKTIAIDEMTLRNLEIVRNNHDGKIYGSLLDTINATITAAGFRLLHTMLLHPLADANAIMYRQDIVAGFTEESIVRKSIQNLLKQVHDIEKIIAKIVLRSGSPRDLGNLSQTLNLLPNLYQALQKSLKPLIRELAETINYQGPLTELLNKALVSDTLPLTPQEGHWLQSGFDSELDEIRRRVSHTQEWLREYEEMEKQKTGIEQLKVRFNTISGFYIEISKTSLKNIALEKIAHLTRKQTLVNVERYSSVELHNFESEYLAAEEKMKARQNVLFSHLCQQVLAEKDNLQKLAKNIALIDVFSSLAQIAEEYHYTRPEISIDNSLVIEEGKHPMIARKLGSSFVANDTILNHDQQQLILITGPNMGGKSTYLRQVALIEILFLIGSFVPAQKARLPLVDHIFTRIGAQDHLLRGMSTFMVEMSETANILRSATEKSLIILDEIGRGTSTYDGLSIAWAICDYLVHSVKAKTLFASHYHELIQVIEDLPHASNASVAIAEQADQITFLYKVVPGGIGKSYGLEVAKRAGLPPSVVQYARHILQELESGIPVPTQAKEDATLFSVPIAPVQSKLEQTLEQLDINTLSPIDALLLLKTWKEKLKQI